MKTLNKPSKILKN